MLVRLLTHKSGYYFDADGTSHEYGNRLDEIEVEDSHGRELIRQGDAVAVSTHRKHDVGEGQETQDAPNMGEGEKDPSGAPIQTVPSLPSQWEEGVPGHEAGRHMPGEGAEKGHEDDFPPAPDVRVRGTTPPRLGDKESHEPGDHLPVPESEVTAAAPRENKGKK